ncbi:hypothetical protein, partial [Pseudoalteromonas sp.]|uniref:hypothetical protein n=1 Tax=Pseudoalteromonas sp. TaxID=53249 RepID=UPI0025F57D42
WPGPKVSSSNLLGRTNSIFSYLKYPVAQLVSALPLSTTRSKFGGSNPLGRTNSIFPYLKYPVAQLIRALPLSMARSKGQ